MPLFPAAKLMDSIIGVDVHAVVGIPIHPYFGPIYLWHSPAFPKADVFINGMPACSIGAMGYFFHIPQGIPLPPTLPNIPYWKRYLLNIPMGLVLITLTLLANVAIAGIAAMIPKPKYAEAFIKDVTGIDSAKTASTWEQVKTSFSVFTQWPIWVKLLMPPIFFPGSQGSTAVGSPNVTVNGGPLAFAGPLVATSCSELPIFPNGTTIGFSNVYVGVSFAELIRGLAVSATQSAIATGVGKGAGALKNRAGGLRGKLRGKSPKARKDGKRNAACGI